MSEKLILVDLDINVEGDNVTAALKKYTAKVVEGMQIIWSINIIWATESSMPTGEVTVEIPGFKPTTPETPDKLFEDYIPIAIPMEQTIPGRPELSAVFASPIVHPSGPTPTPPFLWEWEYVIKIHIDGIEGLSHFKIDPLVVISG